MFTRHLRALCAALFALAALLSSAQLAAAAGGQAASLSDTQFDLGDVPLGSAKYQSLTLRSTGTAPLQPLSITPGPAGYETLFFSKDDTKPLAPGASRRYYVAADPMTLGPVDTTLTLEAGDATGVQWSATLRVKFNAVPAPVLPYAHFDVRLNDVGWNAFLFNDIALQPTGGATGSAPGKFVFRIASGTVSSGNTGVLSSAGGLDLRRSTTSRSLKQIGVDLTRGRLTAILPGSTNRVDIANLEGTSDSYDLEGRLVTSTVISLNAAGAAQLNAAGVRPKIAAGDFIGSIEILKN